MFGVDVHIKRFRSELLVVDITQQNGQVIGAKGGVRYYLPPARIVRPLAQIVLHSESSFSPATELQFIAGGMLSLARPDGTFKLWYMPLVRLVCYNDYPLSLRRGVNVVYRPLYLLPEVVVPRSSFVVFGNPGISKNNPVALEFVYV